MGGREKDISGVRTSATGKRKKHHMPLSHKVTNRVRDGLPMTAILALLFSPSCETIYTSFSWLEMLLAEKYQL